MKEICWQQLGEAGKRLVDWLCSVLHYINPATPPPGAYIHFLLDLYQSETKELDTVFAEGSLAQTRLPGKLIPLAQEDIKSTQNILRTIHAENDLEEFNRTISCYDEIELGARYSEIKRIIGKIFKQVSLNGYTLNSPTIESINADVLLKEMVDKSSHRLFLAITDLPHAVVQAKLRAHKLRFGIICDDHVGRLLAMMSCTVPQDGRILEIGTGVGVGVGTAWIFSGLRNRTDVEVVTIDGDPKLLDATRKYDWPPYLKIIQDYAEEVLPTLGKFNIIFADANPMKYDYVDEILKSLKPGGMLIIDDIRIGTRTIEAHRTKIESLKRKLLNNPQLQALELDWSSGVLLATYCGC